MFRQALLFNQATILVSVCLLCLIVVYRFLDLHRQLMKVILGAFALRLLASVFIDRLGAFAGQSDYIKYDRILWQVAELLREGVLTAPIQVIENPVRNLFYFPYIILYSPIYTVFGHKTLLMRIVFAFIGALFVLNVYRLTEELFGHRSGLWAAGLSAVFPYWIYLSTIFYRDMLTMLVLSQVLYSLIHLGRSYSIWNLSKTLVFVIVSIILRPENILPIGVAFLVAGFVVTRGWRGSIKATFLTGIGAIMSAVVPWVGFDFSINITRLAAQRRFLTRGGGAYLQDIIYSNWFELIAFAPLGAIYFLFVPFPWQAHNYLALIAVLQNLLLWYPIVILAVLALPYALARRPVAVAILGSYTITGIVGYGLLEGNIGPAMRHRSQFGIMFVAFAGVALSERYRFAQLKTLKRVSEKYTGQG